MRRVLPSDVVYAIDEQFGWTREGPRRIENKNETRFQAVAWLPGILRLVEAIPEELLNLNSTDSVRFTLSLSALEEGLARGRNNSNEFGWPALADHSDCLMTVKKALISCPDEAPSTSIRGLPFLVDDRFRRQLGVDLGSAERALNGGEWKAATVLAGSIIEALLLWAIQQHSEIERLEAMKRAVNSKQLTKALQISDLTAWEWSLHPYIEVAYELGEIKKHTANPCREAKYYRNLIHPAASERDKEICTRGKAHGALGAVYSTIEDLEEEHPGTSL